MRTYLLSAVAAAVAMAGASSAMAAIVIYFVRNYIAKGFAMGRV